MLEAVKKSLRGGGVGRQGGRTVEGTLVGDIIHQQYAHGAAVICRGDGAEALLSCRVPNLQLHALAIQFNGPDLEVDADGGDERGRKRVFAEAQQAARLANARVAYQQQLDLERVAVRSASVAERWRGGAVRGQDKGTEGGEELTRKS